MDMRRGLVRRVERLEAATCAVCEPHVIVIYSDEHGRTTGTVSTRPDGSPIPVIVLPALRTPAPEDFQIMATPEELRHRGQR